MYKQLLSVKHLQQSDNNTGSKKMTQNSANGASVLHIAY
jgi:hypothetical protein